MKKTLSICIPTYNRIKELSEVIDSLLTIDSDDFEVVITDNISTDNTKEKITSYTDPRVRYCLNTEALPPFINMIHSIFNAEGKYALYCNDRDILYPEKIENLIEVLRNNDFAFMWSPAKSGSCNGQLKEFSQGYDSLMNNESIHHPTGMIYNRDLIEAHLNEPDYADYLQYINTYDFLMLDLFMYGKSAHYYSGYWGTRPVEFIKKNKSGTRMYFSPEIRELMFYGISDHIFLQNDYSLNEEQKKNLLKKVYIDFCYLICKYKACMADENETAHYGIDKKNIPTLKILKIYKEFFKRSIEHLKEAGYDNSLIEYINGNKTHLYSLVFKYCFKINVINLVKKIKG